MEGANNTYRLEQGGQEYIFSAGIVGNKLRMTCQNSSNPNNKKFLRDFTVTELNKIDNLFTIIKTTEQALEYIDKALSKHKVGINEENGGLKLTFYITSNGVSNQIDIPLGDSGSAIPESNVEVSSANQAYGKVDYMGNSAINTNIDSLLNNAFHENNQDYSNFQNMNVYGTVQPNSSFDINKFIQGDNNNYNNYNNYNYDKSPFIGQVDDSANQYCQNNPQYDQNYNTNQVFQSYQTYDNNAKPYTESASPFIWQNDNGQNNMNYDEEINKILQQTNVNTNVDSADEDVLKAFGNLNISPNQNPTSVFPPQGPSINSQMVDYNLENMNVQKNNDIPFQTVESVQVQGVTAHNVQNVENVQNTQIEQNIITTTTTKEQVNTKEKRSASKTRKGGAKKPTTEKKVKNAESEEVKMLRSQLAELEPLKKRMAEMEVLKGQLTELNTLRAQVAEYNSVKSQLKEMNNLRTQNKQLNLIKEQLTTEVEELRSKVKELEEINQKYEEEIKMYKENERMYSMRSRMTNSENKEVSEDNQADQDEEIVVRGDIIHNKEELEFLAKKINKLNQKLSVYLLYKASTDSDKAAAFHAKCDQAKSSIVLVETDKGKRFGGYTTCSWSGDCIEKKDEEAFVFSLDKMKTYDNIQGEDAIGCYPKFGPIFLGCQIRIYDDAFTKGGTTFERGLNFDTQEDYELTGGDRLFNIKEIEVYEVVKE